MDDSCHYVCIAPLAAHFLQDDSPNFFSPLFFGF